MKNTWKKLGALLISVIMVLAMALPAMAATKEITGTPSANDKGTVSVSGLAEGDKVSFYLIVKATYDEGGFTGYKAVKDTEDTVIPLFDTEGRAIYPTADEIVTLSKDESITTNNEKKYVDVPVTAGTEAEGYKVSKELEAGEWLVLVTSGNADVVYNPMVVSVYYTGEGGKTLTSGELALSENTKYNITGTDAFVKKSTTEVSKTITNNTEEDVATAAAQKNGDDLAIGDTINFQIDSHIPAYTAEYTTVEYKVEDNMDAGLDLKQAAGDIKVFVGGAELPATTGDNVNYTLTPQDHSFVINFSETYLRSLSNAEDTARALKVTYSATLNESAKTNFSDNKNESKITYTHNPGEDSKTIKDETHQYTFEIDGKIDGESTVTKRYGHELIKVNEKGAVESQTWVDDKEEETTVTNALVGAEFTLTLKKNNKGEAAKAEHVYKAVTDENGYFVAKSGDAEFKGFKGLDAGEYELVETKAPEGYSLDSTVHTVKITAEYNEDGTLKSYSIVIDGTNTSKYEKTYPSTGVDEGVSVKDPVTTFIKNTKLNELPSTGGMGTYVFTIIGAAVMAAMAALFFAKRRRDA